MWRDNTERLMHPKVNFVLNHGALGDVITSLPAIAHARRAHHSSMKMFVWAGSWMLDLLSTLLHPYGDFSFRRFEDFPKKAAERNPKEDGPVVVNSIHGNQHTRNRVDMVDFAYATLLDARPESSLQRSYLTDAPLGERPDIWGRYVVLPVGATSGNKEFRAEILGPIIEHLLREGVKPVIVGTKKSHTHALVGGELKPLPITSHYDSLPEDLRERCVDLREKTTLLELRDLCGYASAVVGMDGGTLHLAGTTDVPIVYGCTHILPVHRGITRDGKENWRVEHVVPRNLECAGCQSNWTLVFAQDFRLCAYEDYACTKRPALDPQDFINALQQLTRG